MIPGTSWAYFIFANHSSNIIALPGPAPLKQPAGKKFYTTHSEDFYRLEGKDWKKIEVGYGGGIFDFDVYPGTETTLLIGVRDVLGDPTGDDLWRIGLGKILSEPFRYSLTE
ncbi:MAG: hypothetical protein HZC54_04880 [Verrucomicrobia bacterium]|nr:hypothetical protein [Verrucomicrobiota bacterium]